MKRICLALLLTAICLSTQAQGYWDAYAPQQVFTTGESPVITISGVGRHHLRVQLYQADESKIVRSHLNAVSPIALKGKPVGVAQSVLFQPASKRQDYHAREVRLPRLPAGMYVIVISDQRGNHRAILLWVSDIGLVVKFSSADSLVARVVHQVEGQGVPGVRVAFYANGNAPIAHATTNADGIARLPMRPVDTAMVWAFRGAHRAATYISASQLTPYVQYLFTDRPVYRPGQKVYFKGITRERVENDYRVPPFVRAEVTLVDPENKRVATQTVPINERGTFAGEFQLPEELPLGGYSFHLKYFREEDQTPAQVSEHAGGFEVQEYRKPEFRVRLDPAQKVYLRGETLTFRVQAEYYFGAPVKQAQVRYYVYKRYLWGSDRDEEPDEYRELYQTEEEQEYGGYDELLAQGETTTDERGYAFIRVQARAHTEPCSYAVEAEITDLSLRTEEASASAEVYPAALHLTWRSDAWWLEPGQMGRFRLRAIHPRTGQPLSIPVKVAAYRLRWVRLSREQWRRQETLLWSRTVRTDAQGSASVDFTPPREGEYLLRASAADSAGRIAHREYVVGAYASVYRGEELGARQALEVSLDRKSYLPGERAKVLIRSSVPDADVWLTVEGRKLFASQIVRLRGGVGVVELPAEWQYSPSAFICANLVSNKTLIQVQKLWRVTPSGKLLQVEVIPDKERYLPDEEAVYTVRARDDEGKPVSAEVALGVVDEAIYAIVPDYTPDIRRFFWGATPNAVSTAVSFGRQYAAGAAKDRARAGIEEQVRRRFEDTAFWSPSIVTDANGEAQVRFRMPENLTEWRATARAVTAETAVGTVRSSVKTFKPLLVRLQVPRFLTQGDRSVITGIVHNYTEVSQEVRVSLQVSGAVRLAEGQSRRVVLPPQGQVAVDWHVEASAAGDASFTLTARSDNEFDGIELKLPVYARGTPRMIATASVVKQAVEKRFTLSPRHAPGSFRMVIRVAPSWFGAALGALDEIQTYPYGCVEQTVHPTLSALYVLELLQALEVQDAAREKRTRDAIQRGVIRLSALQHPSGSWGYTEHTPHNAMWTALALEALTRAKRSGIAVSGERISRGIDALYRLISAIPSQPPDVGRLPKQARDRALQEWMHSLNEKAHALSSAAQISPRWAKQPLLRLFAVRGYLGTSSQCALVFGLRSANLPAQAKHLQAEILARVIQTPTTAFWREATPQMQRRNQWTWYAQDTYATACVARMLARYEPKHFLLPKALRWLAEKRQGEYWTSTNDTAQVIMAFTDYVRHAPELVRESHRVRVLVNGDLVQELEYRAGDWLRAEDVVTVPLSRLRDGANVLRIEHQGEGEVVASMMVRYFEPAEQARAVVQQLRVERTYLKRVLRRLTPEERERLRRRHGDESEYLWELRPARGVFRPGEQLVVKLVVHCATDVYYAVIDDPKPAGFEFAGRDERYDWGYWYSRREVRDDRVSFLSVRIPKGKSVITYTLRAERPGQVRARPTQAFGMYLPEINASSGENKVSVAK